ncbi:MAG: class I SAM-dependent methyltransferase [Bacteroidales bacterium]|jgi:ubiquinone/menaquinone biosynthesis C-methylase UbiE|nr:class I SAM-dependent methyltransferase [Bacteroidales bacterium]
MKGQEILHQYFESLAAKRDKWKRRNRFYQRIIEKQFAFIIPEGSSVLELGCSTGDLLNAVKPSKGIGVDFSKTAIEIASRKYPHLAFIHADVLNFSFDEYVDYVIISDLITSLWDVQTFFLLLRSYVSPQTKIIISTYN